jgi:hypothetical protein
MKGMALFVTGLAGLVALSAAAAGERAKEMEWRGKLRTGIVAIGGETTGTVLETDKGSFELDLGRDKQLRQLADKLDGKGVVVKGTLTVRKGVEVKERRIIRVRSLQATADRPKARADVRGRVSRVNPAGGSGLPGSVLVQGDTAARPGYDKAWLRVDAAAIVILEGAR